MSQNINLEEKLKFYIYVVYLFKELSLFIEMEKCHLCFEKCIVPVQLKCFECFDEKKMNCNSLQRICYICYMKSNLDKCSFCRAAKCNDTIGIDFSMMEQDTLSRYTCPFCTTFEGNHVELYQHMVKECLHTCECGKVYPKRDEMQHVQHECNVWKWCSKCKKKVKTCIHFPCQKCGKVCLSESSCTKSIVSCPECNKQMKSKDFLPHILKHIEDSKRRIHLMKDVLSSERKRYYYMMEIVPELYKNVYHESPFDNDVAL